MLMRTKNMLLTAAVIGLAVVAGLLGVGGTWALWNASVQSKAGTVSAANFDVTVNTKSMATNGWTVTVDPVADSKPLSPSQKVYAALTVTNTTDASAPLTMNVAPGRPTVPSADGIEWSKHVNIRSRKIESGTCPAAAYTDQLPVIPDVSRITQKNFVTYCLEVSLKPDPPAELRGKAFTVDVPLTVSQL
jgi:predicted ribosomally synthesized peptide with SipW-like signal peptide